MAESTHIVRLAEICAARVHPTSASFDEAVPQFTSEFNQILDALKGLDPRFMFDRAGRPGAIAAVLGALPAIERELFEAVVEDYECELAATREALFQIARANGAGR